MGNTQAVNAQINALLEQASRMKGMEFRMALEEIVKAGGQEAEHMIIKLITSEALNPDIRMDIIRVAGYLRHPSFLIPLKKVIDTVQHSRIQKEAIISVSKFNDRRALNILNQAIQRINNPMLMSTINAEISRIKENNPILALMPRFQEGQKNPKTFKVALQILKRILSPADATIFTKFLGSPDPLIQSGAFEILCTTGDIMHDSDILGFYKERFTQIECLAEPECEELYMLVHHVKHYLTRYQFQIEEQVPLMIEQFAKAADIRVRQILLSMICKSKEKPAIGFLETTYPDHEKLQPTIIEELSGNTAAEHFLFGLYQSDDPHREAIIKSLLTIRAGLEYFIDKFFTLSFEDQEMVVTHLPYSGDYDLTHFIKQVFGGDTYRLKEILMGKVRDTYEFSVKNILFDPHHEREFFFMGQIYIETITRLFPVTSIKSLLQKILEPDVSVSKAKKFLQIIAPIMEQELVLNFTDKEFIKNLFTKIINSNNRELSVLFLAVLKGIKTLDINTYRIINEALALFITKRETNITPQEKGELTRIKRNMHDLFLVFRRIDEGGTALKKLAQPENQEANETVDEEGPNTDFDRLARVIKNHHLAFVMKEELLLDYLAGELKTCTTTNSREWTEFFLRFPKIARLMKADILTFLERNRGIYFKGMEELADSFASRPPRLVMNFSNRQLTATLREEFAEAAPKVETVFDDLQMKDTDTLLCDGQMMKELILTGKSMPPTIYLFLENLEGFSEFKSYNPKTFVQPFTYYRIVKDILGALYL